MDGGEELQTAHAPDARAARLPLPADPGRDPRGSLPPEFTLRRILRRPIPLDWQEQERLYGI